jgi:chaperone required for assembly of F1-ATPase
MLMNGTVQGQVGNFFITDLLLFSAEVFCSKELISSQDYKYGPIVNEM